MSYVFSFMMVILPLGWLSLSIRKEVKANCAPKRRYSKR